MQHPASPVNTICTGAGSHEFLPVDKNYDASLQVSQLLRAGEPCRMLESAVKDFT